MEREKGKGKEKGAEREKGQREGKMQEFGSKDHEGEGCQRIAQVRGDSCSFNGYYNLYVMGSEFNI